MGMGYENCNISLYEDNILEFQWRISETKHVIKEPEVSTPLIPKSALDTILNQFYLRDSQSISLKDPSHSRFPKLKFSKRFAHKKCTHIPRLPYHSQCPVHYPNNIT
jgi:hypothetical protein